MFYILHICVGSSTMGDGGITQTVFTWRYISSQPCFILSPYNASNPFYARLIHRTQLANT